MIFVFYEFSSLFCISGGSCQFSRMCSARFGSVRTCRFWFSVRLGSTLGPPRVDLGRPGTGTIDFLGSLRGGAAQGNCGEVWGGGSLPHPADRVFHGGPWTCRRSEFFSRCFLFQTFSNFASNKNAKIEDLGGWKTPRKTWTLGKKDGSPRLAI